nr:hypothetical protein [uncultured Dysosmobacter sp.]
MGLRTGGRRAKSLKNRVKSSKIELRFREIRSEGCPSRASVQQALIFQEIPGTVRFQGFSFYSNFAKCGKKPEKVEIHSDKINFQGLILCFKIGVGLPFLQLSHARFCIV